jgi:hypothetical protein
MNVGLRITAHKQPWLHEYISLFVFKSELNNRQHFDGEKWHKHNDFQVENPSFNLDCTEAQVLMDTLYDCGIRPSEGNGSAGAMRATERHLEDMRKLVFGNDISLNPPNQKANP